MSTLNFQQTIWLLYYEGCPLLYNLLHISRIYLQTTRLVLTKSKKIVIALLNLFILCGDFNTHFLYRRSFYYNSRDKNLDKISLKFNLEILQPAKPSLTKLFTWFSPDLVISSSGILRNL